MSHILPSVVAVALSCECARLRGGWAQVQLDFLQSFLVMLGYVPLHNVVQPKPKQITSSIFFGKHQTLPYAADWSAIFVKPIAKENAPDDCAKRRKRHSSLGFDQP